MAIARPVTKTIISTTQFGIPVVDAINRQGFIRTGTDLPGVTTAVTAVPLATVRDSGGNAWTANGANTLFTCPVAGVYHIYVSGFSGTNVPPLSSYVGIHVNGTMRARHYMTANTAPYVSYMANAVLPLAVGDTVGMVTGAGSGTTALGSVPWPGYASDAPAPMMSVWRVAI